MADVYLARDVSTAKTCLEGREQKPDRDSLEICGQRRRASTAAAAVGPWTGTCRRPRYRSFDGYFFIAMEYVEARTWPTESRAAPSHAGSGVDRGESCDFLEKAHEFEAAVDGTRLAGSSRPNQARRNVRLNVSGQVKVSTSESARAWRSPQADAQRLRSLATLA